MTDLTPERIAELRRVTEACGKESPEDEFHCDGCGRLMTRCACAEESFPSIRPILDEIERLRETISSKDRLLPSLIAEGKKMEEDRAKAAEAEIERLRARCAVLERVRNESELACITLENMAKKNTGKLAMFKRWAINEEPLRADAEFGAPRLRAALDAAKEVPAPRRLDQSDPIRTLKGDWCGLCDSSYGCEHPTLRCSECGVVGLSENMPTHVCRDAAKESGRG